MRRGDSFRGRTALAASLAAGFFSLVPVAAEAGFTAFQSISTTGRRLLENGTVYTVTSDLDRELIPFEGYLKDNLTFIRIVIKSALERAYMGKITLIEIELLVQNGRVDIVKPVVGNARV